MDHRRLSAFANFAGYAHTMESINIQNVSLSVNLL